MPVRKILAISHPKVSWWGPQCVAIRNYDDTGEWIDMTQGVRKMKYAYAFTALFGPVLFPAAPTFL